MISGTQGHDLPAASIPVDDIEPSVPPTGRTQSVQLKPEQAEPHNEENSRVITGTVQSPEPTGKPSVEGLENQDLVQDVDEFGLPIRKWESRRSPTRTTAMVSSTDDLHTSRNAENELHRQEVPVRPATVPVEDAGKFPSGQEEGGSTSPHETSVKIESRCGEEQLSPESAKSSEPVSALGPQKPELSKSDHKTSANPSGYVASEWSHQRLTEKDEPNDREDYEEEEEDWRDMTALGPMDVYDDHGRIVARAGKEEGDDNAGYQTIGAAGKGYTRVQDDDDVESVTSLDERTGYLFKEPHTNGVGVEDDLRDQLSQLQATKELLTEGQRIAYVGVTRLTIFQMIKDLESAQTKKSTKKTFAEAIDSMTKWGQQMMIRLYAHMEIDSAEQIMIEQLAEHGVQPGDLVPPLMQNARVKNPMAEEPDTEASPKSSAFEDRKDNLQSSASMASETSSMLSAPPPYAEHTSDELPEVRTPSQLPSSDKLDIDLRWTVLCDLFLVLIADSTYDSRSRRLLESVGEAMEVSWLQVCRFEKRVIEAIEMQEEAAKETWDESDNMEKRRKLALKKKYMVMGLATVGGGLVIGLSAGLLAPVIGAGLAAGFTTIGISGTGAFLGGVGGTALIASGATLTGSTIGVRASHRRTGAVKTFEYRPLHNNKRVNLIVTVSGWMTGGHDDVRLPYSTVDPIMGDIYSVLWEPEMLKSMGATINILATEALTQGLQQVLGNTVLTALMASLQLPIVLTKLSYLIDNPWNNSLARANAAGLILADSLMDRNLGNRPVTLLGFSIGSRLIFACLKELAKKRAFGLVQNVYLFGSPVVANQDEWLKARSVVSGRFVNGYSSNDWILGYLFRATGGGIMRVAGLAPVENVTGIENVDVTHLVPGHMAYRAEMPRLLREVGWEVESDEFAEIEDPDPESHQERQRELIREINEARKEAEKKPDKKKFGFFKRGKLAEKKRWETYEDDPREFSSKNSMDGADPNGNVLFDIDAIRAELAGEQMTVTQLESTMPPMKLDLNSPSKDSTDASISAGPSENSERYAFSPSPGTAASNGESYSKDPADQTAETGYVSAPKSQDPGRYDSWKLEHQGEPQMTFDTSYSSPPVQPSTGLATYLSPTLPTTDKGTPGASNPGGFNLTHNAWADDNGHDEDGVKMTFE